MGLGNDECLLSLTSENKEFDSFLFGALGLTEVGDHLSTLWKLTFGSEDMFSFLRVVKIFEVQSNDIFPIIGSLVSLLSLFVVVLTLFCLCH